MVKKIILYSLVFGMMAGYSVSPLSAKTVKMKVKKSVVAKMGLEAAKNMLKDEYVKQQIGNLNIFVRVKDSQGNKIPLGDATVVYEGPKNGSIVTEKEGGSASLKKIPIGDYTVYVSNSVIGTSEKKTVEVKPGSIYTQVIIEILDEEIEVEVEVGE